MISLSRRDCNHVVCFNPWTKAEGKNAASGCCDYVLGPQASCQHSESDVSSVNLWAVRLMKEVWDVIVIMLFSLSSPAPTTGCYLCRRVRALRPAVGASTSEAAPLYILMFVSVSRRPSVLEHRHRYNCYHVWASV